MTSFRSSCYKQKIDRFLIYLWGWPIRNWGCNFFNEKEKNNNVCSLGDGECNEGSKREAAMAASHFN